MPVLYPFTTQLKRYTDVEGTLRNCCGLLSSSLAVWENITRSSKRDMTRHKTSGRAGGDEVWWAVQCADRYIIYGRTKLDLFTSYSGAHCPWWRIITSCE